ncbi:SDR family NAD(P)-dependent oxidoreductase [Thalassotalea crassostreae]|uniref:SDR family NAD(P)-dependent oxidoreductase n=1 Tax=Thalassotalea crassostreae TaxID=1763536 RepID=UPI000839334E|nr:SDR family NAD(P)-dependent oxidoreductase [Thalassotalea crassostreae]
MNHLFSIDNKVAIVTGGSRGIGKMISQGLVEQGCKVYITARNQTELEATANELNELAGKQLCLPIHADLSTMQGIMTFVEAIKTKEKKIDILINNAGATWGAQYSEFPEVGWDKVMNLNAKAPFFVTQQLLDVLAESATAEEPARVINIASINAFNNPRMTNYSYAASKAAVVQLTRHLAADLVDKNININAIAPGFFLSKMTEYSIENKDQQTFVKNMVPKGRLGNKDDICGAVIYLSSKASNWMTGHTLVLDGGVIAASGFGEYGDFI